MLPDLGKYAGPVLWAYAISILLILGLVALSLIRAARVRRALAAQEARHLAASRAAGQGVRHG
ncbi:heme exporter protein CcmD [Paracoccus sp. p4-l81]|uniref:heme exporter protein CcmD n=1 Tax=unclassified Paracoccus (in: a-proteobacteria) TaxID=2688777 RepID=UPI0035B8289A